jgi:hypothetical protein
MKTRMIILASLMTLMALSLTFVSPAYANGGPVPPTRVIPVTGNGLMSVTSGMANKFAMKDGDEVFLPSMKAKGLKISIIAEMVKALPAALPEEVKYIDALSVNLVKDGKALDRMPNDAQFALFFARDTMLEDFDQTLAIFHWDGSCWQEVISNSLEAKGNTPGLYVLVAR